MEKKTENKEELCELCGKEFESKEELIKHLYKVNRKRQEAILTEVKSWDKE